MEAVTMWITVIAIVLVIAYLVSLRRQPGTTAVLQALGSASSTNVRALAGGVNTP